MSTPTLGDVLVCPSCGEENPDRARFCMACTAPLGVAAPAGSRKTVTIVFSDLVGSTALGEALDSEALREVLDRYFAEMRACLERHSGVVEKYIGDAVMAVFGLPRAHEDDAIRALRAAADMQIALTRLNQELEDRWGVTLTNRTGVHTGEIVTGDPATGQRLVTGDAVNTAARLEQAAPPGEVLISEHTVGVTMGGVQVEAVEPVAAKGKAERLSAYRLVSVTIERPRAGRTDLAMVGRAAELDTLLEAFDRACRERVCVLASVIGEAGVGKTKLVAELLSRVGDRARVGEGRCLSYGEGITYWPVSQIVRQLAGIGESDARDLALQKLDALCEGASDPGRIIERVATAMGLGTSPLPKEELAWGFRKLFEHLGADRPLAVVLDDIHWADPSLLEAIVHVATLARTAPLLLVCMARPQLEEVSPLWTGDVLGHVAIRLGALSEMESEAMVAGLIGGIGIAGDTLREIVAAAEGNPLFLEQMLSMWQDDGTMVVGPSGWELTGRQGLSIPPSIHALLAARLDSLTEEERAVLERGAVVGQVFAREAVEAMSSDALRPGIMAALGALSRRGLIRRGGNAFLEDPAFAFVHLLVRDAAYNGMLKRLRAELHERFARWLLARAGDRLPEFEEIVGYHLEQSHRNLLELGPADERATRLAADAAIHLVASGRRASQRGESAATVNLLGRAVALLADDERRRAGVLYDLGRALLLIGDLSEAHEALVAAQEAAISVGDESTEWRSRLSLSSVESLLDPHALRQDEIRAEAEEAIVVFDRLGDDRGLATGWFHLMATEWMECRFGSALRSIDRAIAHADRTGEQEPMLIGYRIVTLLHGPLPVRACLREYDAIAAGQTVALVEATLRASRGWCRAMLGDFVAGRAELAGAEAIVEDVGQPEIVAVVEESLGRVEAWRGDASAAERAFRRAYVITERMDDLGHLSTSAANLALALHRLGRLDEAEHCALESRRLAADDDVMSQVGARIAIALVRAAMGDLEEAESEAREAIEITEKTEWPNGRGDARMALAEALRLAGKPGKATTWAEAAFAWYERKGDIVSMNRARAFLGGAGLGR
jgi:class 3 adenylate cyclase/tetratricopeptide (TPR) repeat protein